MPIIQMFAEKGFITTAIGQQGLFENLREIVLEWDKGLEEKDISILPIPCILPKAEQNQCIITIILNKKSDRTKERLNELCKKIAHLLRKEYFSSCYVDVSTISQEISEEGFCFLPER